MNDRIYSVSEISAEIKNALFNYFPGTVSITGEVSNYKLHSSGHLYFSLKDQKALIRAVMFSARGKLSADIKDGTKVIAQGRISVYEPQGNYQIIVEKMALSGEGELYREFLRIKKKLENEGLFEESIKKPIPPYPMSIGIVTSETGAVIRDIYNVLKRRAPYVKKYLYPAAVQGANAHESLIEGIEFFNNEFPVDVIIIGRGGGSMEDLWPFNNENLAYTVRNSSIPVISAVGHETDFTIIDFVSDRRAPTPSAAAEIAVRDINDIQAFLNASLDSMDECLRQGVLDVKRNISSLKRDFYISSTGRLNIKKQLLDTLSENMHASLKAKNESVFKKLQRARERMIMLSPSRRYADYSGRIKRLEDRMASAHAAYIEKYKAKMNLLRNSLDNVNPLSILDRGFSLVYNNKNDIIKNYDKVSANEQLKVRLSKGRIDVTVNSSKEDFNGSGETGK